MQHVARWAERQHAAPPALYASEMHGERTQVEVFTRIPDALLHEFSLGPMAILALRCGTVSIRREPADIRARQNLMSTFIFQLTGRSTFNHYGNHITLQEGDITLCNNSRQYEMRLDGRNELIMFRVPTPLVHKSLPSPELIYGQRLAAHQGLASMAVAMVRDIAAGELAQRPSDMSERAARHLLGVLAASFVGLPDATNAASAIMSTRFSNVKLFIEEHLRDDALKPALVAQSVGVSDRYLRMIFAAGEESPSTYILRRRLEECAAQLRDPQWRHHSITSIAFGWGFNSAPHFARSFRARFDCSPRAYRRRMLGLHE